MYIRKHKATRLNYKIVSDKSVSNLNKDKTFYIMNSNTRLYRMVLIAELVIFIFVYKLYIFPNIDITLLNVTQAMYIIKSFYLFILI